MANAAANLPGPVCVSGQDKLALQLQRKTNWLINLRTQNASAAMTIRVQGTVGIYKNKKMEQSDFRPDYPAGISGRNSGRAGLPV